MRAVGQIKKKTQQRVVKLFREQGGQIDRQNTATGARRPPGWNRRGDGGRSARPPVETSVKTPVKTTVKTPVKILQLLRAHPRMTLAEVAAAIGKSVSAVQHASAKLVKEGYLQYTGPAKGGHWEVKGDRVGESGQPAINPPNPTPLKPDKKPPNPLSCGAPIKAKPGSRKKQL
jgi:hypothetical protein